MLALDGGKAMTVPRLWRTAAGRWRLLLPAWHLSLLRLADNDLMIGDTIGHCGGWPLLSCSRRFRARHDRAAIRYFSRPAFDMRFAGERPYGPPAWGAC